ncbi:monovalent cation/H+ antiporter subunit E [Thiosulfatimonas sediminis]|uniref:Monovalent cation/H+ antiporter subunit E n=1 Tax=Thiosulfatimonas sediminis TaxID=2675054 RepID=A0A6F8PRC2_9GAMM|nr:Na+/H+ antiporter subunit E [Thiosulfatimonas sediminis]BBP44682.1 monovalent cation/H+ antiporter subunit E [Thiosulfatimonas sediminis]
MKFVPRFPQPLLSLTLFLIWLLLNNDFSPGQLLLGLFLAWAIPLFTQVFWPHPICLRKPFTLIKFLFIVLGDIVVANFVVAHRILSSTKKLQPTFLAIPLDLQHPIAISIFANTISLTPGTVSCHLSDDRKILLVHALDSAKPQHDIAQIKQRYEHPLKEVFESCCN